MIYQGARDGNEIKILAGGEPLPIRTDVFRHSSIMDWGHLGSSPAQLALALLLHVTGREPLSLTYHQQFKQEVVSQFPVEGWTISSDEIEAWLEKARTGRGEAA